MRIRLLRGRKTQTSYNSEVLSVSQSVGGGQKLQNHDLGFGCGINTEQDLERMLLQWVNTEAEALEQNFQRGNKCHRQKPTTKSKSAMQISEKLQVD